MALIVAEEKTQRKRGTLLDWLVTLAVIGVFGVVLHRGIVRDWSEHGVPSWMQRYEKWEKRTLYEWRIGRR